MNPAETPDPPDPCPCGGEPQRAVLKMHDFSPICGIPLLVSGMPGLVCPCCGRQDVEARELHQVLRMLVGRLLSLPRRLRAAEVRFLRKHLCLSRRELAGRLGVKPKQVRAWEGRRIRRQPRKLETELCEVGVTTSHKGRKARERIPRKHDLALRALLTEPCQAARVYLV